MNTPAYYYNHVQQAVSALRSGDLAKDALQELSRLDSPDLTSCRRVLKALIGDKFTSITLAPLLTVAHQWPQYKQIIYFHAELIKLLTLTNLGQELPIGLLGNLPYPNFYVATPGYDFLGFWVHLDKELCDSHFTLRFVLDFPDKTKIPSFFPLLPTLKESLAHGQKSLAKGPNTVIGEALDLVDSSLVEFYRKDLPLLLNCLYYLHSDVAEFEAGIKGGKTVKGPHIKRPPKNPTINTVGFSQAKYFCPPGGQKGATQGTTKTPHVRRGHYHLYRVGPKRLHSQIKWIAPQLINAGKGELGSSVKVV